MKVKDVIKILQERDPEQELYIAYNNRTEILTNIEITGKHKSVMLLTLTTPKPTFIGINDIPVPSCSNIYRPIKLFDHIKTNELNGFKNKNQWEEWINKEVGYPTHPPKRIGNDE